MIDSPSDLPPLDKQYFGPAYSCQLLQCTPGQLRVLMQETGVQVAMMLDNSPLIDGVGMQALVNKANEIRAEIEEARQLAAKAGSN